jgi:hypothetical protein
MMRRNLARIARNLRSLWLAVPADPMKACQHCRSGANTLLTVCLQQTAGAWAACFKRPQRGARSASGPKPTALPTSRVVIVGSLLIIIPQPCHRLQSSSHQRRQTSWVLPDGVGAMSASCLLCTRKRTSLRLQLMSAKCQKRTSFDHLVGAGEQAVGERYAQ